jgi:hypothetical protein
MGAAVRACDMEVFSLAYVSGSTVKQVLRGVSCDACKTSEVLLSADVLIYFKECSDAEQSLTCPSEMLMQTVSTAVTLMECMMAEVAHVRSVKHQYHSCHYEHHCL